MSMVDIIRAWRDEEYRASLREAERALLPEHPAGLMELSDAELGFVSGAADTTCVCDTCDTDCTCNANCGVSQYSGSACCG